MTSQAIINDEVRTLRAALEQAQARAESMTAKEKHETIPMVHPNHPCYGVDLWNCREQDVEIAKGQGYITFDEFVQSRDAAVREAEVRRENFEVMTQRLIKTENERNTARADLARLTAAATDVADDVCSMLCPSVKKTGTEWTHVEKCVNLRAALGAKETRE